MGIELEGMYRKVVFSKEPTVLKLESATDEAAFVHLKHRGHAFYLGGRRDQFGVYPGDLAVSALQRAYFTVSPTGTGTDTYQMNVDALKTKTIRCSQIELPSATVSSSEGALSITVPSANGSIQFGATGTPWVTLHSNVFQLHGDVVCQRLYTEAGAITPNIPVSPPVLPLDAQGKIPREYLPEVYQTSLIHNHVGVGIGTEVPRQKLHVEGSGFLRGRVGVNVETPVASVHVSPPVATPGLRLDVAVGSPSNAFEIYAGGNEDAIVQMHPNGIHLEPPVTMRAFSVPNHLYYKHQRLTVTDPTLIQAPLTVRALASENAQPLVIDAPRVECPELRTREWTYPLAEADTGTRTNDTVLDIPMTFQGAKMSLAEGTIGFNDAAWSEAYRSGDELARLLMKDETTLPMSRLVAYLWDTVQALRARVRVLEQKS